ncbi:uncharacterized protein [Triticum aestivum]|uniref:uncharacterized protein n=1 Tax=Triticum aestivum TaxID=4565 RepID=UPI001D025893|nr:uncharacterized protein LOC123156537 [Triticum aestivum]XP_044430596.1 uncharacterized protein LOC123156537 [Triticum aestivum]XP_044430597.1 uncharacterized protein LOC123156537 [Triticum aestivum]XP_044430598.1 uncharacterized protein LOC123156537 [Triticum aestivum]XP_044430599.1 uncharacterized protein LOC123156537 [Triticum aestivum]XP_044430600.1 uncharacterized protein LOC123156537 [Triticum aestivum]XP_044430601.1 uncharacterized protein LOC123156537 [Triticum aestivum]XP_04443060
MCGGPGVEVPVSGAGLLEGHLVEGGVERGWIPRRRMRRRRGRPSVHQGVRLVRSGGTRAEYARGVGRNPRRASRRREGCPPRGEVPQPRSLAGAGWRCGVPTPARVTTAAATATATPTSAVGMPTARTTAAPALHGGLAAVGAGGATVAGGPAVARGGGTATAKADGEGGGTVGAVPGVLSELLKKKPRTGLIEGRERGLHRKYGGDHLVSAGESTQELQRQGPVLDGLVDVRQGVRQRLEPPAIFRDPQIALGERTEFGAEMHGLGGLVGEEEVTDLAPDAIGGVVLAANDLVQGVGDGGVEEQKEGQVCVAPCRCLLVGVGVVVDVAGDGVHGEDAAPEFAPLGVAAGLDIQLEGDEAADVIEVVDGGDGGGR